MRNVSFGLAVGFLLVACGGSDENQTAKTPVTPVATGAPTTAVTEPPKEEAKPRESFADLQQKTLKSHVEATNARDAKKLASLYSEGAVVKIAGAPSDASGREAIGQSYQKLFDAFGDYKVAPSRIFVKGDVAVVEWAFNATHTGDLWGIKASEKKVGAQGVDVLWFTPDGQIKEQHVYYDGGTILSQIGLSKRKARPIPALAATPQIVPATGSPDETKNVEVAKNLESAFDAKKDVEWLGLMADNVEYDDMTQAETSKGKAEGKKFFKEITTAFPDTKSSVVSSWGFGDIVVTESSWTGTHKAPFFGLPATKKTVTVKGIDISQFKDGKLVKGAGYSNGADFMQQLGVLPAPSAAKTGEKKVAPADAKAAPTADKKVVPADPKGAAPAKK